MGAIDFAGCWGSGQDEFHRNSTHAIIPCSPPPSLRDGGIKTKRPSANYLRGYAHLATKPRTFPEAS